MSGCVPWDASSDSTTGIYADVLRSMERHRVGSSLFAAVRCPLFAPFPVADGARRR